jgi:hypothetical protein
MFAAALVTSRQHRASRIAGARTAAASAAADADLMTVGGEINKVASNIELARNFTGIHWRPDYTQGLLFGEVVVLNVL